MAGAGNADARRNKRIFPDMDRRCVQDHAVIIDHRQPVGVDVEAIITAEGRFDERQRVARSQKLPQDLCPHIPLLRTGLIVPPAQHFCLFLKLSRHVPVV